MYFKRLFAIASLFAFISCQHNDSTEFKGGILKDNIGLQAPGQNEQAPKSPANTQQHTDPLQIQTPAQSAATSDWHKKIIKTANLTLEVKDCKAYSAFIYKTVKQSGGYIANEIQQVLDEKLETSVTIKIPVEQFETMINYLPGGVVKVLERKIETEDVTGEMVDVKGRLEAKKQMRQQYFALLKHAKNIQEVLQVQAEINGLQETMESAEGRVNYLHHHAAMSTIHLTFYQPLDGNSQGSTSYLTRVGEAFNSGVKWMGNLLIGFIALWPLLPLLAACIFLLRKTRRPSGKQPNS